VRLQQITCLTHSVTAITGPGIVGRMRHHPGTHRVEFDVAHAGQQIAFIRDQAALVPALPECATLSVASIDVTNVVSPGILDYTADGFLRLWRHQQVHMIGHQYIGVNATPVFQTRLMQPPQIGSIVVIRKENRLPAVPALDEMRRDTRQVESWLSRHRQSLS